MTAALLPVWLQEKKKGALHLSQVITADWCIYRPAAAGCASGGSLPTPRPAGTSVTSASPGQSPGLSWGLVARMCTHLASEDLSGFSTGTCRTPLSSQLLQSSRYPQMYFSKGERVCISTVITPDEERQLYICHESMFLLILKSRSQHLSQLGWINFNYMIRVKISWKSGRQCSESAPAANPPKILATTHPVLSQLQTLLHWALGQKRSWNQAWIICKINAIYTLPNGSSNTSKRGLLHLSWSSLDLWGRLFY